MSYHGRGMYQWDTWYCVHAPTQTVHAFYLQQRRPGSDRTAQEESSLGHAVSTNLFDWTELPPILPPHPPGQTGDLQSWTGSCIELNGKYHLYYTIRSSSNAYKHQQIGLAVSDDLMTWEEYAGNPVLTPDPRWYNTPEHPAAHGLVCCRDLMVVKHDRRPGLFGVFATRMPTEELPQGAVFAGAYSEDGRHWQQTPPLYRSPEHRYNIVEMPDLFYWEGRWVLTWLEDTLYGNREVLGTPYGTCGTVYAVSDRLEGPYTEPTDNQLLCSMGYNGFSLRTVDFKGKKYAMYSRGERLQENEQKPVCGSLAPPKEMRTVDGRLRLCLAADLLLNRQTARYSFEGGLPPRINHHIYYENEGRWQRDANSLQGAVRYAWCRYCFEPEVADCLLSATVTLEQGIAAGVTLRQACDHRNAMTALTVFFDEPRQVIAAATLPRFQVIDQRPFPVERGRAYRLQVLNNHPFVEVYVDEVLWLQFVSYVGAEIGSLGLLVDRGRARFAQIDVRTLQL